MHKYALDTDNTYVEENMNDEPDAVPPSQPVPVNRRLFEDEAAGPPPLPDAAPAADSARVLDLVSPVKDEKEPEPSRPVARPLLRLKNTLASAANRKRELGLIDRKGKKAKTKPSESDAEAEGDRRPSMLIFPVPEFQPGYRQEQDEGNEGCASEPEKPSADEAFLDRRTQLKLNPEGKAKAKGKSKAKAKAKASGARAKAEAEEEEDLAADNDSAAGGSKDGLVGKGTGKKKGGGKGKKSGKAKRAKEANLDEEADGHEGACSDHSDADEEVGATEAAPAARKASGKGKAKAKGKSMGKGKAKAKAAAGSAHVAPAPAALADLEREAVAEGAARKRLVSYPSVKDPSEVMELLQGEDMMMRIVLDMLAAADNEENQGPPTVKTLPRYTYFNLSVYWTRSAIGLIRRNPKPPHTYIGTLSSAKLDMMSVAIESISHMAPWFEIAGLQLMFALTLWLCVCVGVCMCVATSGAY